MSVVEEKALVIQPPTPMQLIALATEKGADPQTLAQLLDLQLKWQANEARMAFVRAMAAFKANPPDVTKNKHVKAGPMEYDHATLDHATEIISSALQKVGIVHRWETNTDQGRIRVTCVLTHEMGHSEKAATLEGPPDTSGSKGNVQAIGSTTTYLQRYTLFAAVGIAPKGMVRDDDGRTEGLPDQAVQDYLSAIEGAHDQVDLQTVFGEAWNKAKACNDTASQNIFRNAYDKRKRFFAQQTRGAK